MSEAIEEIGGKRDKRKDAIMEAWAAMIYGNGPRPGEVGYSNDTAGCGGSSLPKDTLYLSDPKTLKDKAARLKAVKAANESAQAQARRTQDTVAPAQQVAQVADPKAVDVPRHVEQAAKVEQAQQENEVRQTERAQEAREETQVVAEEAAQDAAENQPPTRLENSKEVSERRVQVMSLTGIESPDQVTANREADPPSPPGGELTAEQAALVASLKSGAGSTPELAAKAYVQASSMDGVKGTLREGLFQDYVIAL